MGLRQDAGSVAMLKERTEGWIAGLQMAALSMRDREDVPGFIEGFSGTNRYILDYLLEEVLASQAPEIQRFLLYTSILERLAAPLCEAVFADDEVDKDKEFEPSTGSDLVSILEYLEKANLFLVPLDDERTWYRYHHLFADLLQARLQQTLGIQFVPLLHQRAARWYEQNGLTLEAIHHASLTSKPEWVEHLIEQNYMEIGQRREFSSLRFWRGKLSKEMVFRRPRLCIHEAMSCSWFGKLDEADELLAQAEKLVRAGNLDPETQSLLGYIAFVKSRVTAMRGDVRKVIELCLTAFENTPASNQALLAGIGVMLGYGYFLDGDFANAIHTINETIQSGRTSGAVNSTIGAHCVLARLYTIQGQLNRAYELYQKAGKSAHEVAGQKLGVIAVVDVGIAEILCEWNDLDAALIHVKRGLEFIQYWGKADDSALAYTTQARILQAQGNTTAALEAIAKGVLLIETNGVFSEAREAVVTAEVRLQLEQGNNLAAARWAESLEEGVRAGDSFRFDNELAHITLVKVLLAQNRLDEAVDLISRLEAQAETGGRTGRLIEILILKAMAMQKMGQPARALVTLEQCLALAELEGYTRIFLDEGRSMQMLIAQWLAHDSASPMRDYAIQLLSQFDAEPQGYATAQEKGFPTGGLIEPLSQRELEVLQLVALGKTNHEIARQLFVSPGTVKAHTASIYRKLDVANRTEAVAHARERGILT
jgi:LuxR family maltose regulon positive regulatory protein